jgi:hypothetical protein
VRTSHDDGVGVGGSREVEREGTVLLHVHRASTAVRVLEPAVKEALTEPAAARDTGSAGDVVTTDSAPTPAMLLRRYGRLLRRDEARPPEA